MKLYLIDDDASVIAILKIMIEQKGLGDVCGTACNGVDALADLSYTLPDIVIVDLLMPLMDGITFVKKAKEKFPDICYVMLSQVSNKDMIAQAYEAGITFFIQKPVNGIEVVRVLNQVTDTILMKRTFLQMQSLLMKEPNPTTSSIPPQETSIDQNSNTDYRAYTNPSNYSNQEEKPHIKKLRAILQKLGITGENGSADIITIVDYMIEQGGGTCKFTISQLCVKFSPGNAKSMEQRIRRAITAGLTNLANLGIEDYSNDTFQDFAGSLYAFEQVRKEMDCIRGKSVIHGKVSLKNFLNSLMVSCLN